MEKRKNILNTIIINIIYFTIFYFSFIFFFKIILLGFYSHKRKINKKNLNENEINQIHIKKYKQLNLNEPIYQLNKEENIIKKDEYNYINMTFDSIKDSYNKAKDFIEKGIKDIYIQNKEKFKLTENPKISSITPVYNSKEFISRAIKSIQNQNILDIEIILIDDYSTDGTLKLIKNIQKEDPRIKIIENKKNRGILYSRSIGVLSAKGKYLFSLDNDDMFLDQNIFSIITTIAIKDNIDITEFRGILMKGKNFLDTTIENIHFTNHKLNNILNQPDLGDYPIKPIFSKKGIYYKLKDVYLWNKCIKTIIYRNALNYLGEKKYSRFMLAHEDLLIIFILFNIAKSFKFVGKFGICHFSRFGSAFGQTDRWQHHLKELLFNRNYY